MSVALAIYELIGTVARIFGGRPPRLDMVHMRLKFTTKENKPEVQETPEERTRRAMAARPWHLKKWEAQQAAKKAAEEKAAEDAQNNR